MFHKPVETVPTSQTVPDRVTDELIPLSYLELDLPTPVEGWPAFLAARDIEITLDDVGRASITRAAVRELLTEEREREARGREKAAELERQAIEADQQRRAQIWGGLPAYAIPPGVAPAAAMLQAAVDSRPRRQSVLQHALSNTGELTFHPIRSDEG